MKQPSNPEFARAAQEALAKARKLNDLPHVLEAIDRAALLIASTPENAEEILREKFMEKSI